MDDTQQKIFLAELIERVDELSDRVECLEQEIALHVGGLDAHSDRLAVLEDALYRMTGEWAMDRDHELARNYGDISRGSREVEGDWYLIETIDGRKWIDKFETGAKQTIIDFYTGEIGRSLTFVDVFRRGEK